MWNRRFRLFIGSNGGNILHGLHLRFSRLGPAGMFSTVPARQVHEDRSETCPTGAWLLLRQYEFDNVQNVRSV